MERREQQEGLLSTQREAGRWSVLGGVSSGPSLPRWQGMQMKAGNPGGELRRAFRGSLGSPAPSHILSLLMSRLCL